MNSFTKQFCKLQRSYIKRSTTVTNSLFKSKPKLNDIVIRAASTKLLENVVCNSAMVNCNTLYINALSVEDEDGT